MTLSWVQIARLAWRIIDTGRLRAPAPNLVPGE